MHVRNTSALRRRSGLELLHLWLMSKMMSMCLGSSACIDNNG